MLKRLKYWRKLRGFTQETLGERFGCAHSQIQKWENGKKPVKSTDVIKLAKILEVHPGELFAPLPTERPKAEEQAANLARRMPEEARNAWFQVGTRLIGPESEGPNGHPTPHR